MNSAQRRKLIRKKNTRSFDILMGNCERALTRVCPACASALSLPLFLASDTAFGCPDKHWKQWLAERGEESLVVLLRAVDEQEGIPEWLERDIREEAARRAEGILVNTTGENNE